jgi:hypothetical protein
MLLASTSRCRPRQPQLPISATPTLASIGSTGDPAALGLRSGVGTSLRRGYLTTSQDLTLSGLTKRNLIVTMLSL